MERKTLRTDLAPAAIGPYSQGIALGSLVFTSGQLPIDPATGLMPDTIEAQRLVAEQKQRPFADCELWGPIAYDLILSKEAARLKDYDCPWSGGGFDGIIAPDLSTANTLVKSWLIHAHAVTCGAVVGAKVPIALTSRSANEEETYLSLVFCAVH